MQLSRWSDEWATRPADRSHSDYRCPLRGTLSLVHDDDATPQRDEHTRPLDASREGDTVRLSGTARDLEELGQIVAAAEAEPGVQRVDVDDVEVTQPDSGLYE